MKSKKKQTASELMTLEGDSIPQPVRKKRGGLRLKAKHHRRLKKALAVGSAFAILVGGTFGINAIFFNKAAPNIVERVLRQSGMTCLRTVLRPICTLLLKISAT